MTSFGNTTTSPAIVYINPPPTRRPKPSTPPTPSPLTAQGPDDLAIATSRTTNQQCTSFSDFLFAAEGLPDTLSSPQHLANAVWRFAPASRTLKTTISPSTYKPQTPQQ
ncbi:hypothetical protein LTR70_001933 [Exophiala xenobiotica]|nr:hypothetical protein LTR70_001933 [Exophiala xenobiotica]